MQIHSATICRSATLRVITGTPSDWAIADEAVKLGCHRVFLLASRSLNDKTEEIEKIRTALGKRHVQTFVGIEQHVPVANVLAATEAALSVAADLIVTVGGGSVTDAGKIVSMALKANLRSLDDLPKLSARYPVAGAADAPRETAPDVPVICVPTTLSGGEFSNGGGATDLQHRIIGFAHREATPAVVILDPWITRHTPEWLWLSTGVRAVDHAVETLASLQSNDYCDSIAETALRMLAAMLPRCAIDRGDFVARLKCQIATWLSMTPILAGVPMGASHALGHAAGRTLGIPHGYTSCIFMPFVQQWNGDCIRERLEVVSLALGGKRDTPAHVLLDSLIRSLGLPRSFAEAGVKIGQGQLELIAERAYEDIWGKTNPRLIFGPQDMMEILRLVAGQA